jgi:aromatic ring-opening dioxygenase catalytic subunit (LigB family)
MVRSIFVSHGSPTLLVEDGEYVELLKKLGYEFKSKGIDLIIIASPHWITHDELLVQTSPNLDCIQDYYGFPDELYGFIYEAKNDFDFTVKLVSSASSQTPETHFEWGKCIREIAEKLNRNVLFIGTGSTTHRLDKIVWGYVENRVYPPGEKFDKILLELLEKGEYEKVLKLSEDDLFYQAMPEGRLSTMYITLGVAGKGSKGEVLYYGGWAYGVSMCAVKFY